MARPRILQIGIDPAVVDFSPWPGQDAEGLRSRIADAAASLRDQGLDVVACLVTDDPDAAGSAALAAMADGPFDAVEIGSGLRTSHEYTAVFERVVNTVVAGQPGVPLCFNDSPETTQEAVRRVLPR